MRCNHFSEERSDHFQRGCPNTHPQRWPTWNVQTRGSKQIHTLPSTPPPPRVIFLTRGRSREKENSCDTHPQPVHCRGMWRGRERKRERSEVASACWAAQLPAAPAALTLHTGQGPGQLPGSDTHTSSSDMVRVDYFWGEKGGAVTRCLERKDGSELGPRGDITDRTCSTLSSWHPAHRAPHQL